MVDCRLYVTLTLTLIILILLFFTFSAVNLFFIYIEKSANIVELNPDFKIIVGSVKQIISFTLLMLAIIAIASIIIFIVGVRYGSRDR